VIRVLHIDHVVLRTSRLAAMTDFYCAVLGCAVERSLPAEIGLTQLRAGAALIDLVDVDSQLGRAGGPAPAAGGRNLDHLCLEIEALEVNELSAWLERRGVKAGAIETRYGASGFGPSMYIADPDGNTVELRLSRVGKGL
jgi:catechol 2,3-dioxygenase-like lactoylglutathione lyase family enzyme